MFVTNTSQIFALSDESNRIELIEVILLMFHQMFHQMFHLFTMCISSTLKIDIRFLINSFNQW